MPGCVCDWIWYVQYVSVLRVRCVCVYVVGVYMSCVCGMCIFVHSDGKAIIQFSIVLV